MSSTPSEETPTRDPALFVFAASRPVAVTMIVLAAVVFGTVGLVQLPVDLLPDVSYPTLTIRTEAPGGGPEDIEEQISEPLQESVSVVPGVRRAVSISRTDVSDIQLEFAWGTEMPFAIADVQERLERVFLPPIAKRPLVLRYDPSLDPVMTIGIFGALDSKELRRLAEDEVERELAKIDGVAAVKIRGGAEEEIRIAVDESALTALRIDTETISNRLQAENVNTAAGSIEEGRTEFLVRTLGEFENLEEIRQVVIDRRNGAPIRLREVATVERVAKDRDVISRIDGQTCVLVDVFKEAGANVVALAKRVRERLSGTPEQQAYVAGLSGSLTAPEPPPGADEKARAFLRSLFARNTNFLEFRVQRGGAELSVLQDQSVFIEQSIREVQQSAVLGGVLAILVILLFLRRLSTTAILAVSIPISLIAAFAPMFLSDITLNVMSLGGLALGVGMLVDNSIVVLESITRAREQGHGVRRAAILGVSRVAAAVTASTLTTVAVFFPIVFVEGLAGQLFRDQSLTVVYSLLMSLGVALLVIPMLASRSQPEQLADPDPEPSEVPRPRATWKRAAAAPVQAVGFAIGALTALFLSPFWLFALVLNDEPVERFAQGTFSGSTQRGGAFVVRICLLALGLLSRVLGLVFKPIAVGFDEVYGQLESLYPKILDRCLRLRLAVLGVATALLAIAALRVGSLGAEILPEVAAGEFYVEIFLPRQSTVERTDEIVSPIEREIAALDGVESTFLAVGVDRDELNSAEEGEHSARILVRVAETSDLQSTEDRLRTAIRGRLERIPEIQDFRFESPSVLAFDTPLVVELVGDNLRLLQQASRQVEDLLRQTEGLADVRATLQRGNPEIVVRLDREKMSSLGLDTGIVSNILGRKIEGDVPTRFSERDRKVDLRVAIAREELNRVDRLMQVNVNPSGSPAIPLSTIAYVERLDGPSEIRRLGNTRGAEIQATVRGFDLATAQAQIDDALLSLDLPDGVEARLGGQKEEFERSQRSVLLALGLAIFLVYVVMASQFESFVQPFVILVSLPLALVGVILVLELSGTPISVLVMLGCIVLAGIVVNNAIILIDQINQLRRHQGIPKHEAILQGARTRLRPVLMTTTTTVLGLMPLTGWFGGGDGVELRAPLAITVVAGLSASTLLTLLVIPVVYTFSDRRA
ncbi:MAG: efflux RND transporter permease subunit [Planctomycetota bacterium]